MVGLKKGGLIFEKLLARISHKVLGINASNGLPGGCSQEKSNEGLVSTKSNWFFSRTVGWECVSRV